MSDKGEQMRSILDDAREKIADEIKSWPLLALKGGSPYYTLKATQILAISGTTDIECPANGCVKGQYMMHDKHYTCRLCLGMGTIQSKWKVSVTLENGELPELGDYGNDTINTATRTAELNILLARYRQVVE